MAQFHCPIQCYFQLIHPKQCCCFFFNPVKDLLFFLLKVQRGYHEECWVGKSTLQFDTCSSFFLQSTRSMYLQNFNISVKWHTRENPSEESIHASIFRKHIHIHNKHTNYQLFLSYPLIRTCCSSICFVFCYH